MIFQPPNTQGSMGPFGLLLFHLNVPLETQMRLGDPICEALGEEVRQWSPPRLPI